MTKSCPQILVVMNSRCATVGTCGMCLVVTTAAVIKAESAVILLAVITSAVSR